MNRTQEGDSKLIVSYCDKNCNFTHVALDGKERQQDEETEENSRKIEFSFVRRFLPLSPR
jgi:hypothetical protein